MPEGIRMSPGIKPYIRQSASENKQGEHINNGSSVKALKPILKTSSSAAHEQYMRGGGSSRNS